MHTLLASIGRVDAAFTKMSTSISIKQKRTTNSNVMSNGFPFVLNINFSSTAVILCNTISLDVSSEVIGLVNETSCDILYIELVHSAS